MSSIIKLIRVSDNVLSVYSETFDGVKTIKVTQLLGAIL